MISRISFFVITLMVAFSSFAKIENTDSSGLALEGFDPVSYFRDEAKVQGPLKGDSKYRYQFENVTYWFSSQENMNKFKLNPSIYVPAFGGWCAYAVAVKNEKVEVDVKSFIIQEGRLLLFYDGFLADTRKKWLQNGALAAAEYLKTANQNWPNLRDR